MNLLDLLLLLIVVAYAVSGFRRGLVASIVLLAGFLGGAVLGVWALPYALEPFEAGTTTAAVVAVAVVLLPAALGHALAEPPRLAAAAQADVGAGARHRRCGRCGRQFAGGAAGRLGGRERARIGEFDGAHA
ncbi:hypothetical protein GCM10020000_47780 [Streptomyces olivoverticillatus]